MRQKLVEKLILSCLETLRKQDFKESTIKRYRCQFNQLIGYMKLNGQVMYSESIGEKYQVDIFEKRNFSCYTQKCIRNSIDRLNEILNHEPVQKKHLYLKTFPLPGELGKHAQSFLERLKIEIRPTDHTLNMYVTALSHFTVRMQQDHFILENLDSVAISKFIASLQNTQMYVCVPVRRFLRYLFEKNLTKTDFSTPLFYIKCHRAEKVPSVYNAREIRMMDASIDKSSPVGKRDYAIFLLASRLGLRASDMCLLQFSNLDWDRNVINLVQFKTKKEIELPLLAVIGEAIIDYILNSRPKSESKTIFLTAKAPHTMISVPGISGIISNIIYKAGIETKTRHHGAHCLRHSLATQLMEQGTTLPVISDTLGHSNSQTTMIYLSVDINGLLRCSLDVPPVPDCFYMQKGGWFYE